MKKNELIVPEICCVCCGDSVEKDDFYYTFGKYSVCDACRDVDLVSDNPQLLFVDKISKQINNELQHSEIRGNNET
jgi:hypothetical protein